MKKYFGIISIALCAGLISCVSDDDAETAAPAGGGGTNFESNVRFIEDGETVNYPAIATFTERYVEEFERYVFSIDVVENPDISVSKFLIGMSIYNDTPSLATLSENTNYELNDSWIVSGQEGALGLGVTWREGDGSSTLYTDVAEGNLFITDISAARIRARFSFKVVAPISGDTLTASTSLIIARPE